MRAQAGRFDECWPRLERAIWLAREHGAQENLDGRLRDLSLRDLSGGNLACADDQRGRACVEQSKLRSGGQPVFADLRVVPPRDPAFLDGDYRPPKSNNAEAFAQARAAGTALDWLSLELAVCADSCPRAATPNRDRHGTGRIAAADAAVPGFKLPLLVAAAAEALSAPGAARHDIAAVIATRASWYARAAATRCCRASARPRPA